LKKSASAKPAVPEVLAPSDAARVARRRGVRVGGRVVGVDGTRVIVADALGSIVVELARPAKLAVGELVVVQGAMASQRGPGPSRLAGATLVERHAGKEPTGQSEFWRVAIRPLGRALAARSDAFAEIRSYFEKERFVEVDTPVLVPAPGLDAHVEALRAGRGYLATSPEFHMKRLLAGGLPRIYQLGHCFRADEAGAWHEPEFMLLEWYRSFAGIEDVIGDTERIVCRVVERLAGSRRIVCAGRAVEVRAPFERMTVARAFARFAGESDASALAERDEERFFELLVERVEPSLARARRPVFLTDYPAALAALARRSPRDTRVAERFELYLGGIELSNGYGELTDAAEQAARFRAERARRRREKRPVYPVDARFISALAEGMPPAAGNALGVDRLIALALGRDGIGAVTAFRREDG
jgi:lysyl-tRNA synthetase class 2